MTSNKILDCALRSLAEGDAMPQIQAMAQELLERREKDKPKSLKSPITDKALESKIEYWSQVRPDHEMAATYRELLEYRKRTRRDTIQDGDVLYFGCPSKKQVQDLSFAQGLVGSKRMDIIYIPYDSLKDLHE